MSKLSVQTKQASAQESLTTSSVNNDQESRVVTIKKFMKEAFDKHEKKIDEIIQLHLRSKI